MKLYLAGAISYNPEKADADFYGEPRIPQEERTVPQRLLEILETKEQLNPVQPQFDLY